MRSPKSSVSSRANDQDGLDAKASAKFVLGNTVALRDETHDDCYWLADVKELRGDDSALVHLRGTQTAAVERAVFKLVWIESKTGLSILAERLTKRLVSPGCSASPWTGVVHFTEILLEDVKLTRSLRLPAKSRNALSSLLHKILP